MACFHHRKWWGVARKEVGPDIEGIDGGVMEWPASMWGVARKRGGPRYRVMPLKYFGVARPYTSSESNFFVLIKR